MKTELEQQLQQAELEKIRAIDRVKDIKAKIAEASKEPSIYELMPIGSVWCRYKVVNHDRRSKAYPVGVEDRMFGYKTFPGRRNLRKLISEQKKLDAMKRAADEVLDYCKRNSFPDSSLCNAVKEYKTTIEKDAE